MEKFLKKIGTLPLFKGIEEEKLRIYLSKIHYYEKKYEKGAALIVQGMPYKALYILIDGKCAGEMADASGKILKIEDFEAPYALASALLFAGDNRIPVTIWAKTDVHLLIIKREELVSLCRKDKRFLLNLFGDVADKFTFISNKLMYLQFKSLRDKILFYLSAQQSDESGRVLLKQSIQELSTLFGVERPSLSRALSQMEKEGIIQRKAKRIKVIKK
jgi:CRP-like cAMP-binding protein